ncbi:DUF6777 domain-containing protein [Kitasatospora sp. NPDC088548]|uniref:DUF6777 domain-containing protein n=1 Tax=Kitasatospora sp. NPDC088548 TaxID=3364075 RepID=UPI003800C285
MATVLIVSNQHNDAVPTANEVALQQPSDPGQAPFTQSVETAGVTAPAPASPPAQPTDRPSGTRTTAAPAAGIHSVEGTSPGLYAGSMSKPSCDVERLITMTSSGDVGRAWASAQGISQSAIPGYLRSLTSAYLRVDTRVTNHGYKSGAVTGYQSVLQAGTAVLVDAQGVPRVRCACGNPLKPPVLVSDAEYTGKAWPGFRPTTLVVVVPAPQPVTEIVLVNVDTGTFFARATGRVEVIDRPVPGPSGPLAVGIPPAAPMKPSSPSASVSGATSASTSASSPGASSGSYSGSSSGSSSASTSEATSSSGPSSGSASASSSSGKPSGPSSAPGTSSGGSSPTSSTSSAPESSGPSSTPGSSGPPSAPRPSGPSSATGAPSTATTATNPATGPTTVLPPTGTAAPGRSPS